MAYPSHPELGFRQRQPVWGMGDMISHGAFPQYRPFFKTGYNPSISDPEEAVWTAGGAHNWIASAGQVRVVSNSAEDTMTTGTGAWKVTIYYLNAAFEEKSVEIELANTTPVASGAGTADIYRINSFRVTAAGANGVAAGTINVYHASAATIYSQIAAGETRARNLQYTVPKDKEIYIQSFHVGSGGTTVDKGFLRFQLQAKWNDSTYAASTTFQTLAEISVSTQSTQIMFDIPVRIPEGIDLEVTADGNSATAGAFATCSIRGYLESE